MLYRIVRGNDVLFSRQPRFSPLCVGLSFPSHDVAEESDKEAKEREPGIEVAQSPAKFPPFSFP